MVAASTVATAQATARSRMRSARTSRRSAWSCLLSLRPRTGRSGERITAAANTGPNSAPRPTSSTPATKRKPRARTSRSMVPSQRILPTACSANMGSCVPGVLCPLFQARCFTLQPAKIVQLRAPDLTGSNYVDVIDHLGVQREDTLHSMAEAHFPHRDRLAHPGVIAGDESAFEGLQPFLIAFLDLD